MSTQWMRQRERGSPALIRLIAWITLRLGYPMGRLLLGPITGYFLLFNGNARRASRVYLGKVLGHAPRLGEIYRHFHHFASVLLDRVYLLSGRHDYFSVEIEGMEVLHQQMEHGGCILLGSHLGSFEILRALAICEYDHLLKVLMYEENTGKVNAVLNALNPEVANSVIPIGKTFGLLKVKETLDAGGLVGILGDRIVSDDKALVVDFLGQPARLPEGPLLLASILKAPVILFFGIYLGKRRYRIHFELLGERIELDRQRREQSLQPWVQAYAHSVQRMTRKYPFNWFNFYDFWKCDE